MHFLHLQETTKLHWWMQSDKCLPMWTICLHALGPDCRYTWPPLLLTSLEDLKWQNQQVHMSPQLTLSCSQTNRNQWTKYLAGYNSVNENCYWRQWASQRQAGSLDMSRRWWWNAKVNYVTKICWRKKELTLGGPCLYNWSQFGDWWAWHLFIFRGRL